MCCRVTERTEERELSYTVALRSEREKEKYHMCLTKIVAKCAVALRSERETQKEKKKQKKTHMCPTKCFGKLIFAVRKGRKEGKKMGDNQNVRTKTQKRCSAQPHAGDEVPAK